MEKKDDKYLPLSGTAFGLSDSSFQPQAFSDLVDQYGHGFSMGNGFIDLMKQEFTGGRGKRIKRLIDERQGMVTVANWDLCEFFVGGDGVVSASFIKDDIPVGLSVILVHIDDDKVVVGGEDANYSMHEYKVAEIIEGINGRPKVYNLKPVELWSGENDPFPFSQGYVAKGKKLVAGMIEED